MQVPLLRLNAGGRCHGDGFLAGSWRQFDEMDDGIAIHTVGGIAFTYAVSFRELQGARRAVVVETDVGSHSVFTFGKSVQVNLCALFVLAHKLSAGYVVVGTVSSECAFHETVLKPVRQA